MSVRDLIPWGRNNGDSAPALIRDREHDPFLALHREVNRLFDDVFRSFGSSLPSFGTTSAFASDWPSVEISDDGKQVKVTAEVPGLEEKDIEVLLETACSPSGGKSNRRRRTKAAGSPSATMAASSAAFRSVSRSKKTRSTRASEMAC